jgi:hypothetical protein
LKDPHFDIREFLPQPAGSEAADTYIYSPSEYPISDDPISERWEDHELQALQHLPQSEELLQATVYKPTDNFTTPAADQPSFLGDYPISSFHLHSNEMTVEAVPGPQPEHRATQGESREPAAVADDKAIHGNFIPVSHSHSNSRGRNKHKSQSSSYETVLRLSLTDEQVDKITSVYVVSALAFPSSPTNILPGSPMKTTLLPPASVYWASGTKKLEHPSRPLGRARQRK